MDEYKQHVRDGLRRLLDPPGDAVGGPAESIVVYVKPSSVDAFSKGPGKVRAAYTPPYLPPCHLVNLTHPHHAPEAGFATAIGQSITCCGLDAHDGESGCPRQITADAAPRLCRLCIGFPIIFYLSWRQFGGLSLRRVCLCRSEHPEQLMHSRK